MPYIDNSGPPEVIVAKLIANAFQLSGIGKNMVIGQNNTPLTSGEKFVLDSLSMTQTFASTTLASLKLADALKVAELAGGIAPGMQALTYALTGGVMAAQYALERKHEAELGYRKPTAPTAKTILSERSAQTTEAMKTFASLDLETLEEKTELYERVLGEEEPTAVIDNLDVATLKSIGGALHSLDSKSEHKIDPTQSKLVKAFEEGCKNYKPGFVNRPSEDSRLLQALMIPSKRETKGSKLLEALVPANFPYNIDEKRFLKWIQTRTAHEQLSSKVGKESLGNRMIDRAKLTNEVETLKAMLAKKDDELTHQEIGIMAGLAALDPKYKKGSSQISMDAILTYIVLHRRQNVIRDDMKLMHDFLQDKDLSPAQKMQAIVTCLPKLNEKGELAISINKELKKLESDPELTEDLNTCYFQSYGFLHDKYLEKSADKEKETKKEGELWNRGEASDFILKALKTTSIEQAFDNMVDRTPSPDVVLPNMAQVAAFMGLLSPEDDQREIMACEVYLSMMQSYLHLKISEKDPEKADEIMSSVHAVLQNVANVSRSQRHVRLDKKSTPFNHAHTVASATSTVLGVAATLSAPLPPLALALGVASGTISAAGSALNWLQWSVSDAEKVSQIVLPTALTLPELERTVEGISVQLREKMEQSKALDDQGLNPFDQLCDLDADIAEKVGDYRGFLGASLKEIEELNGQIELLKEACRQDLGNFHRHWQDIRHLNLQINNKMSEIGTQLNKHEKLVQLSCENYREKAKSAEAEHKVEVQPSAPLLSEIERKVEVKPSAPLLSDIERHQVNKEPPAPQHVEHSAPPLDVRFAEAVVVHEEIPVTVHTESPANPIQQPPEPIVEKPKDLNLRCNEFKQRYKDMIEEQPQQVNETKHQEVEVEPEEEEEEEEVEVEKTSKQMLVL